MPGTESWFPRHRFGWGEAMNVRVSRLIASAVVVVWIFGSGRVDATVMPVGDYSMRGTYAGILPCEDCAGIWTELTLNDMGVNTGVGKGTFLMTERYTGGIHGGAIVATQGSWLGAGVAQSYTGDVTLDYVTPGGEDAAPIYFYCDHGRYLRLLAARSKKFAFAEARPGFSLLQRELPHQLFGPLTEADSRAPIFARVGDVFEVRLTATSLKSTLTYWTIAPSTEKGVEAQGAGGSGNGDHYTSDFILRAVAAGRASVVFSGTDRRAPPVTFSFDIAP
jgi:hypothetical protein